MTHRGIVAAVATALAVVGLAAGPAGATVAAAGAPGDVPVAQQASILAQENAKIASASAGTASPLSTSATTGSHTLARATSVRHSDRITIVGYAQAGDRMDVERYSQFTNASGGHSEWAVGTVYTQAGALYGYVLYDSTTFR